MAMDRRDPYLAFRFMVEIDGLQVGGFNEVSGLALETTVETFQEGGVNAYERQLAGPTKFPSKLSLKRGLADVEDLWSWYQDVISGRIKRRRLTISLLDDTAEKKWQWVFSNACPIKWTGPNFQAGTNLVAFETIELVHEGLQASEKNGLK